MMEIRGEARFVKRRDDRPGRPAMIIIGEVLAVPGLSLTDRELRLEGIYVAFGAAYQFVHEAGQNPKIGLVRS